jgi:hypothetical protein
MAETTNYMIAGYAVIFSAMALYLVSLVVRFRNLRADEQVMEEIKVLQEKKKTNQDGAKNNLH